MKKMNLFLPTVFLVGILGAPLNARALEDSEYTTNGMITFEPSEEETKPVDPTDPTKPITPIDPTNPNGPEEGTAGPLSLDYASSLDFGKQKITSSKQVYYAKAQSYLDGNGQSKTGPNYVQVTDNRGTEAGWHLQVKQNSQFKTANNEELTGAQITFKNGTTISASESAKPTGEATIIVKPTNEWTDVMMATEGQGAGTHLLTWGNDQETAEKSIELSVPGTTTKYAKKYETTFTWVLADTPKN